MNPILTPDDIQNLKRLNPALLFAKYQQSLTKEEQLEYGRMTLLILRAAEPEIAAAASRKGIKKKSTKKNELAQAEAKGVAKEKKRGHDFTQLLVRMPDIEEDIKTRMRLWEQGSPIIADDLPQIDPVDDTAGSSKIVDLTL